MSLRQEFLDLKTTDKALRDFAFTIGGVLGAWSGLHFWKHHEFVWPVLALAALFLVLGVLKPSLLRGAYVLWMGLALCMGWVMSRVLLTVLFYFVFTPLGLCLKLMGKDLMRRRPVPGVTTYWNDHAPKTRESHSNQF